MATLLLVFIYIFYIGLGLPDSLLGAAWPAIYAQWDLPVSLASVLSVIISLGTVLASLLSARLIHKLGTPLVTALSTALAAVGLLGYSLAPNFLFLCLASVPLGIGAGSIDTALNNYVALHYNAMQMSFLHCFYGVGVSVSPYVLSLALGETMDWRKGYRIIFLFQTIIALLSFVTLPLWKKATQERKEEETPPRVVPLREIARNQKAWAVCGVFAGISALESTCTVWGGTFLNESVGFAADEAAARVTLYFLGLTVGRFFSGLLNLKLSPWKIIAAGQGIILAAIVLLFVPDHPQTAVAGLFLIGLGNGPIFPNMTHLTPTLFGKDASQAMIGIQMALSYTSILLTPVLFGVLANFFGTNILPLFLLCMFLFMTLCIFRLLHLRRQQPQSS